MSNMFDALGLDELMIEEQLEGLTDCKYSADYIYEKTTPVGTTRGIPSAQSVAMLL